MGPEQTEFLSYKRARFVTELPVNYLYSPGHFWIGRQAERVFRVGLTKFGTRMLGEMVDYGFEAAPGSNIAPGLVIGWIEGFKAVSEIFCIAEGQFVEVNPALEKNIALVNHEPYGAGWLYSIKGAPDASCMEVHGYAKLLDQTIDRLLEKG